MPSGCSAVLRIAGILLLGGASKRYGRPKALEKLGDRTFLEIVFKTLSLVSDEVFVSYSDKTPLEAVELAKRLGSVLVHDRDLPCNGPPRGIASIASNSEDVDWFYIIAVDHPFTSMELLERLKDLSLKYKVNAATPLTAKDYPMVTLGFIDSETLSRFKDACMVKKEFSRVTDLYRGASRTLYVGWSMLTSNPRTMFNVNTPNPGNASVPPLYESVIAEGNIFSKAITCLEQGDHGCAAREFMLESDMYYSLGITLLGDHAFRDAERFSVI